MKTVDSEREQKLIQLYKSFLDLTDKSLGEGYSGLEVGDQINKFNIKDEGILH